MATHVEGTEKGRPSSRESLPISGCRLLLVTANLGGGTGTHVSELLRRWKVHGPSVHVLCQGSCDIPVDEGIGFTGSPRRGALDRFPVAQVRRLAQLRQVARTARPDIVHTYFFWPTIYGRLLKKAGVIRTLVENREDQGFSLNSWDYRMLRATASLPDRVICVSEAVRRTVLENEGLAEERTVVIRNGIRPPTSEARPADVQVVREELGFSPEDRIVGMVSNLNRPIKGVRFFIEAMPAILRQEPAARFLILGSGHLEPELRRRADALRVSSKVVFAGFRTDLDRLYPAMEISVLTSLSEGLSMTVLESMAFGLPVVATEVGGNPEIIRHEETGLLVPPRDPAALSEAVVRLLRDREYARLLGGRGREVVREDFSMDVVASRYLSVYEELLAEGPHGPRPNSLSPSD